ncbi:MAG: radical SAM protein [Firmicutes bacterium]|nr:radical SAM protein [Bacillota bacterium]
MYTKGEALKLFKELSILQKNEDVKLLDYDEAMKIVFLQIEKATSKIHDNLLSKIKNVKNLDKRTIYVGSEQKFPYGCKSCLLGNGLGAIRKTNKCNLECKFCYYYGELDKQPAIVGDVWEIGGTLFYEQDIDLLLTIYDKPSGIAYVYLEPLVEIEKYYPVIKKFNDAGIYQHLYTNGVLATEENLKSLGDAGLDEIRFNLGATNCSDKVIHNIEIAKKYIKSVGIETPMTPEFFNTFFEKKDKILNTNLDFINCAELHLNESNIANYFGESLYMSRQGYVSPIWSRALTLKLMKIADDEKWNVAIHDCSNHTKFARHLNASNKLKRPFGNSSYSSEFNELPLDAFFAVLEDDYIDF